MSRTVAQLRQYGYSEAEIRSHSLGWLTQVCEDLSAKRRADHANQMHATLLAVAAANGSEEAAAAIEAYDAELASTNEESSADHLTDPDAETDWTALHQFASGMTSQGVPIQGGPGLAVQRVHKEAHDDS